MANAMNEASLIQKCLVEDCRLTATETGMCFYHDRCPPEEITVSQAAKVLHDTRYKREQKRKIIEESTTEEWEASPLDEEQPITLVVEPANPALPPNETPATRKIDVVYDIESMGDKTCSSMVLMDFVSGGTLHLYLTVNPFQQSLEDRYFINDLVDMVKQYVRRNHISEITTNPTIREDVLEELRKRTP